MCRVLCADGASGSSLLSHRAHTFAVDRNKSWKTKLENPRKLKTNLARLRRTRSNPSKESASEISRAHPVQRHRHLWKKPKRNSKLPGNIHAPLSTPDVFLVTTVTFRGSVVRCFRKRRSSRSPPTFAVIVQQEENTSQLASQKQLLLEASPAWTKIADAATVLVCWPDTRMRPLSHFLLPRRKPCLGVKLAALVLL